MPEGANTILSRLLFMLEYNLPRFLLFWASLEQEGLDSGCKSICKLSNIDSWRTFCC